MGNHRTANTQEKTQIPIPRAQTRTRRKSPHRHPLGGPAPGDGLWLRHDLLATPARLAKGGRMGQNPQDPAQQIAASRTDRFFPCSSGFRLCTSGFWGAKTGPNPTDRCKKGSKHHLVMDANRVPLVVKLTGANCHDLTKLLPLVDSIPPIAGKVGRSRRRPDAVLGDRGYDSQPHRKKLRKKGITPELVKRRCGNGLGVYRWVVEHALAWFNRNRRLRVRYDRRDDIHQASLLWPVSKSVGTI